MVSGRALKMYSWTAYKIFSGQKECLSKPPQTPLPMGLRLLLRRIVKLGWSSEHHLLKYIRIHSSHINIHALISIFIVLIMPRLKPIIVRFTWLLISSHHQTFKQVLLFYSLVVFFEWKFLEGLTVGLKCYEGEKLVLWSCLSMTCTVLHKSLMPKILQIL